jgi:hypothetical protein
VRYVGVSVALLAVVGCGVLAQPVPPGLWGEALLGAEVGAVLGGAIGLGTVHTACIRIERSCDPLYKMVVLQQRIPIEGDLLSVVRLNSPGFHTVNMGRGIGALAGVALVGVMRHVEGNIWMAFLATQVWVAASQHFFLLKFPLVPALVATAAYSWGARLKSPKVSPGWSVTLFSEKF